MGGLSVVVVQRMPRVPRGSDLLGSHVRIPLVSIVRGSKLWASGTSAPCLRTDSWSECCLPLTTPRCTALPQLLTTHHATLHCHNR
jgi:hypothetical protein